MRNAFVEALCELAEADPRVWLLTADLGWGALLSWSPVGILKVQPQTQNVNQPTNVDKTPY